MIFPPLRSIIFGMALFAGLLPAGTSFCDELHHLDGDNILDVESTPDAGAKDFNQGCAGGVFGDCCCYHGPKTIFSWNACCPEEDEDDGADEPLVTDRPDFTEASSTVGYGRLQIEMGYTYFYNRDGTASVATQTFPETLFRIGLFREWFELRIVYTAIDQQTSANFIRAGETGSDDLQVGCKIALTEQCGCLPEMAIIPQIFVPVGSDAFTNDEVLPGLNWVYSWDITDRFGVAGSTQGNRVRDDSGHYHLELAQSATAGVSITERLGGYAEWFAFFPHGAVDLGAKPAHFFNGGFTYLVNNDLQLDARAGLGLNDAADDYFVGAGLSKRF